MSFDLDTAASEPAPTGGGLDMDLGFNAPTPAADTSSNMIDFSAPTLPESGSGLDFSPGGGASFGGNAIDFSSDETDSEIAVEAASPSDVGEAALPGWDETATKLDLAKAYIDMGDSEGARSILDEVLAEGTTSRSSRPASWPRKSPPDPGSAVRRIRPTGQRWGVFRSRVRNRQA
ncbi:MAG: hypothetical protein MZW92_29140 [Comamonadaceae bacterium]|nr:hypothetical protein [Comamonadaceae bacterium]